MSQNDYLTDIVRKVVEPVMGQLVGVLTIFRPVIWRSIAYAFFLCVTYLLHSPFRTSNVSRTDSYAKVNKVVQTWCVLVLSCFHIAPKLFEDQKAEKCDGGETVATLFFPIFFMSTLFFLFLHKEKRKLKMGVTYGSSLSYVLLNSIVLALFATVHYTYIYRSDLFSKSKTGPFRYFLKVVSVPQVHDTPFKAILKLFSMCLLFTGLDYLYKRWHGFDPTRGILWSDLYDIEKAHIFDEEGSSTTDWRTLVPKPVVYRKEEEAPDGDAVVEGEYPENNSFVAGPPPTKKIIRGSRSTVFDFSIDGEADEIAEGKHPINRPAMVPWWSTFVFITAWQTFAANVLGFLSFDVRLMQPRAFPKIFNLHFVSKVAPDQAVKSEGGKGYRCVV
ncbi:hypothetical protein ADEAN_000273600 [Angomonas deanei]|uniref:Uncharacterized protein n=1 Tax=Angomonas deanei TaxID=59799 RepID=A0A7G2C8B7_9TRYP|nr:hypothetical protein ADEAN_000273600 [Angomonas deanei]